MAAKAMSVVAKTLLSEEGETVIKTAARMIRTTVTEESGAGMSFQSVAMESSARTEAGLGRGGQGALKAPEIDIGNAPREVELPGSRTAPEIKPVKSDEIIITSPKEVDFPDVKTAEPELKPGEIDVAEEVGKGVPTDPEALIFTVEQGRKHNRPEVGEHRTVVEVDDRHEKIQESTEDGEKTQDTGRADGEPEVGSNPLNQLI
ncbi:hypothetical protein BV898_05783 [Hypsibius exemplaris]|uniref:Uncharacterized protein n=1 Tax=Hypsibius exemplaris TaxID=2072580 RepID=A0A1W0WYF4_HYPEX|nr:hypothetical protein BV898_05783 [Hypsibius exemplaris]